MGLSLDLSQFDVAVTPGMPAAILNIREEQQDVSAWSLYDLSPGDGYMGALAVKGHPMLLKYWQYRQSPSERGGYQENSL